MPGCSGPPPNVTGKHGIAVELLERTQRDDPVFGPARTRVAAAARPPLEAVQDAGDINVELSIDQILDLVVAIAKIPGETSYRQSILSAPRDRPMAWSCGSPAGALFTRPGRVLMRAHDRGVHRHGPVHVLIGVGPGHQRGENLSQVPSTAASATGCRHRASCRTAPAGAPTVIPPGTSTQSHRLPPGDPATGHPAEASDPGNNGSIRAHRA